MPEILKQTSVPGKTGNVWQSVSRSLHFTAAWRFPEAASLLICRALRGESLCDDGAELVDIVQEAPSTELPATMA